MISEDDKIKTNSLAAWLLAARPKTLTGAAVPVMIGTAWAWKTGGAESFQALPAILCFLFAFLMQVDSNFINDYFDCVKGNDDRTTRLGPKRACSEGWITLPAMRIGIVATSVLACLSGLPLVIYGGWEMVIVGAACVLFAFLYTTFFSYLGLGDLLVLVFFGIIPVTLTYYVILPTPLQFILPEVVLSGIVCGLVIDTLLVINNYRDRDNDRRDGKMTLVVRIGAKKTEDMYRWLGMTAFFIMFIILFTGEQHSWKDCLLGLLIYAPYMFLHEKASRAMTGIKQGKELNKVLGITARNMFVYGILTSIAILVS
ncbi:MAG: 1,4-dihydroxy-2-naphthoate octaprenyltransferase [Prevotella sp.]|nr:1,4-dihydroxy-2-naphthoate octaprenyltransferase [Prevotella sp.]